MSIDQLFSEQIDALETQIKSVQAENNVKRAKLLRRKKNAYINQRGICVFCNKFMYLTDNQPRCKSSFATIEHIIPRSHGGKNYKDNLVVSCYRCNTARRDMDYDAFKYFVETLDNYDQIKILSKKLHLWGMKTLGEVVECFIMGKINC